MPRRNLDPYKSPRAFYASELLRLREAAGLTQAQLAEHVFCHDSNIAHFESGTRRPQVETSKMFDEVFDTGQHLQRLCALARRSGHAEYFADAAELEERALTISEYSPMLVPGFLQTEAYARAFTKSARPFAAEDEIEELVRTRMERARLLEKEHPPKVWEIIHEAALHVVVGSPEVMHEQLLAVVEAGRSRRYLVQVHPFTGGPHPFMTGVVSLMSFADSSPVVYVEGAYTGQLIDDPTVAGRYRKAYDLARAAALSPAASLLLIESVAKGFATDEHRT
ncbi:Scr1 family TA system antitoxin-like transcriptional regulator [Embleya sp. NPDC059259]|uniref:helix-turn-helix domain-containing protein n=1 Tax=unclassified Embleya TaxID=2699296 RepID=UPI0036BC6B43